MTAEGLLFAVVVAARADTSASSFIGPLPPAPALSATSPAASSTAIMDMLPLPEAFTRVQVRRMYMRAAPEAAISLPDGQGRIVIETPVGRSAVRMGAHYNFINGRMEMWLTYVLALMRDDMHLQVAASDVIGLGTVYTQARHLARGRTVPLGISRQFRWGSALVNIERTSWRFASYDIPSAGEGGLIDAAGVEVTTHADRVPDVIDMLRHETSRRETTTFRYRRAFQALGGDFHFDRADADIRYWMHGLRREDELMLRLYYGQAWNISPLLPERETFGLGGAAALKGYRHEEFRGPGALIGGTEYLLFLPWTLRLWKRRVDFHEMALLVFAEGGRIQSEWWHGLTPFRWSAGLGARFRGRMLGSQKTVFRVYAAQAGEWTARRPIFYFIADLG